MVMYCDLRDSDRLLKSPWVLLAELSLLAVFVLKTLFLRLSRFILIANIESENISIPVDLAKQFDNNWVRREFPEKHNELAENRAMQFLKRLHVDGCSIVAAADCSPEEVRAAYEENRYFADDNLCGYVLKKAD
jgi:hypothetical protein